jgi:glycosyltransferase involved in cell wall biosynthesis
VLHTLHWTLDRHAEFYAAFDGRGRVFCNALSDTHAAQAGPNLRRQIVGSVPNGVDLAAFPFRAAKDDYFVVLARVAETKGQDIAARVCHERGLELVLAGPVAGISSVDAFAAALADERADIRARPAARFYLERVRPYLDGRRARWVGSVGGTAKLDLLGRARALLMPVRWEEAFGLVVIEAMACGTPVIAMNRGSLGGIVEHGVNGFLAGDEAELAGYLDRVDEIDPAACRRTVERRFTADAMAAQYVALYERVVALAAGAVGPG